VGILSGCSRDDGGGKVCLLVGDRLVVVYVGFKSKDQEGRKGCGAVKSGRVKMARVEVKLLFRFICVWGRGGAAPRARVLGMMGF